ncbi:unnamed protein product [Nippostrongylus brasiliensis]|uniref:Secreted protein n=1 Tax=Nippostrongylus brasiliensis TaxID=27835 RepID=A0A0N4Y7B5_NIPBR|nr:unnamed protein product [Nippostrongylus brasiliensis]
MQTVTLIVLVAVLIQCTWQLTDSNDVIRAKRSIAESSGEGSGEKIEASGEGSGEGKEAEASGEGSGEGSGEASGEEGSGAEAKVNEKKEKKDKAILVAVL